MDIFSNRLWMLGFLTIIHQAQAYINGNFPQSCDSMDVIHKTRMVQILPQDGHPPFKVQTIRAGPDLLTVTLQSNTGEMFRGFMLEARNKTNNFTVGQFFILEPKQTFLLNCSSLIGSAVSQKTNTEKKSLKVNWTSKVGDVQGVIFRATFLKTFAEFWRPTDFNVTVESPSTTPASTSQSSTPSTINTTHVDPPTPDERTVKNTDTALMTAAVFVTSFVESVPLSFPNNAKYHNIHQWIRILGCVGTISLALSASVLVVVEDSLNSVNIGLGFAMTAIAGIAIGLQIYVCFRIGRSHELKDFFDHSLMVLFIIQKVFAIIFIYLSTTQCQLWILGVLISLTVCIGLQITCIVIIKVLEATGAKNKTGMQTPQVRITLTISILFTLAFCVAIIVGICQC
ncbi:putative ferric-chelate reductase 1 homolog isoform X2 [Periophthalmus magnuspinnatus]|uniref:putative ferric-chelate reductase 1 homolog isoform X2 n=1 Tax=Periophthalmus magnuspinnatus TaxID=409849 RepID=UPI00145C15BF|nr:putative ferric-chelate reductase 1 homolog isoform X2 [Periophthalmus magnuspinnatus]